MGLGVKETISNVFSSTFIEGFWRVAENFFKFRYFTEAANAYYRHPFFKVLVLPFMLFFNFAGAVIFLCLSIILSLGLVLYVIPRVAFSVLADLFSW